MRMIPGIVAPGTAATVLPMLLLLLGIVTGVAIGIGKLPAFDVLANSIADAAVALGYDGTEAVIRILGVNSDNTTVVVVRTVVVALMPGVMAGVLLGVARGGAVLRKVGAALAVVAAVGAFLALDAPQNVVAAGALLLIGIFSALVVGSALSFVASAVAALLATVQIRAAISGDVERYLDATAKLAEVAGVGSLGFWSQALAISGAVLPVMVLFAAFRD